MWKCMRVGGECEQGGEVGGGRVGVRSERGDVVGVKESTREGGER